LDTYDEDRKASADVFNDEDVIKKFHKRVSKAMADDISHHSIAEHHKKHKK